MPLVLVTAPATEPVTLDEAKLHLRVDSSADDGMITAMVAAARQQVEAETSRSLITTAWRLDLHSWPASSDDVIVLPRAPLLSVSAVQYVDEGGGVQTLAPSAYHVTAPRGYAAGFASIECASYASWPVTADQPDAVRISFTAGYGATASDVPAAIKAAMLLMVGGLYGLREDAVTGTIITDNPTVARLLAPLRMHGWET